MVVHIAPPIFCAVFVNAPKAILIADHDIAVVITAFEFARFAFWTCRCGNADVGLTYFIWFTRNNLNDVRFVAVIQRFTVLTNIDGAFIAIALNTGVCRIIAAIWAGNRRPFVIDAHPHILAKALSLPQLTSIPDGGIITPRNIKPSDHPCEQADQIAFVHISFLRQ